MKRLLLWPLAYSGFGLNLIAAIIIPSPGIAHLENFDTLGNTGTSSTLPPGWALAESGANANAVYTAGTGSSNGGDTYSYGESGSTDRALGGLQSSSLIPMFGAEFLNNSVSTISSLRLSYRGEAWRLGTADRTDRLDFQFSTDATSLTTGTWTDFDGLDFVTPNTAGPTGARNGNTEFTQVSGELNALNLPNGGRFWVRWVDFNASGSDDGLAVDDFQLVTTPEPAAYGVIAGLGLVGFALGRRWLRRQQSRHSA